MYGYAKIPKQRVPLSQKSEQWRKDCVNAFINISKFGLSERRNTLKTLYDYYNGEIDEQDYKYVLKPYGKTRENFPSKLRNYPIIKPIIDLLLGEKSKRPMNYTVVVENADAITMKEEAKKQSLLTNIQATFIAKLQQQMDPNNPQQQQQQPELPKQIIEQFESCSL